MENEQYIVEIFASKSGIALRRSAPRSKEAAERIAANFRESLEEGTTLAVRVVPYAAPKGKETATETAADVKSNAYRSRVE